MALGRSDDFLRRRSNEERPQDYCSITLCLWKPYSNHKTNSTVAIVEYKSHALCLFLSVCVQNVLKNDTCLFCSETNKKGQNAWLYISAFLTSSPLGSVFVCLCIYLCLFGCLVSECSLSRGGFTALGKTVQAERSDKVTSAALSEWTHRNTFPLTHSHYALIDLAQWG